MIKLKSLLETLVEAKKLDLNKKEDAAEYLIKQAWEYMPPGEDRYDSHDLMLWIDNESLLNNLAWGLSKKFYPNEEESWYMFKNDVENVLFNMEQKRLDRKRAKTPSLKDPIYILKKLMVGKNWASAKRSIANQLPGRYTNSNISDDNAEQIFNRLYKNAMGETVYKKELIDAYSYGRLNQLRVVPVNDLKSKADHDQYVINQFIKHYGDSDKIEGKVRVWRGTNSPHAVVRPGDFVTFDRGYAENYLSGKWKSIIVDILDSKDLLLYKADPGMSELVYWPEGHQIKKYEGKIPTLREFWEAYRFGI
jgi:hypothetical protein